MTVRESTLNLVEAVLRFPAKTDPNPLTHLVLTAGDPKKPVILNVRTNPVRPELLEVVHDGFRFTFRSTADAVDKYLSLAQYKPF